MTRSIGFAAALVGWVLLVPASRGWSVQANFGFGKQEVALSLGYAPATPLGGAIRNVQYGYVAPNGVSASAIRWAATPGTEGTSSLSPGELSSGKSNRTAASEAASPR